MSIVVVNAVTVPAERAEEFEQRFAQRAGQVSQSPGFEAFELLRPADGTRYLVYTRWRARRLRRVDEVDVLLRRTPAAQAGRPGLLRERGVVVRSAAGRVCIGNGGSSRGPHHDPQRRADDPVHSFERPGRSERQQAEHAGGDHVPDRHVARAERAATRARLRASGASRRCARPHPRRRLDRAHPSREQGARHGAPARVAGRRLTSSAARAPRYEAVKGCS
jgi:Antibiotic biosynthesis monooxygenase